MEEQRIAKAHKLVVNNRKTSTVTGVLDVLSFDLNDPLISEILICDMAVSGRKQKKPPHCF